MRGGEKKTDISSSGTREKKAAAKRESSSDPFKQNKAIFPSNKIEPSDLICFLQELHSLLAIDQSISKRLESSFQENRAGHRETAQRHNRHLEGRKQTQQQLPLIPKLCSPRSSNKSSIHRSARKQQYTNESTYRPPWPSLK